MKTGLPGVKVYIVPGVGHVWNAEKPELFARMVRAWVKDEDLPEELKPLGS